MYMGIYISIYIYIRLNVKLREVNVSNCYFPHTNDII